jgi:hypothetical protein
MECLAERERTGVCVLLRAYARAFVFTDGAGLRSLFVAVVSLSHCLASRVSARNGTIETMRRDNKTITEGDNCLCLRLASRLQGIRARNRADGRRRALVLVPAVRAAALHASWQASLVVGDTHESAGVRHRQPVAGFLRIAAGAVCGVRRRPWLVQVVQPRCRSLGSAACRRLPWFGSSAYEAQQKERVTLSRRMLSRTRFERLIDHHAPRAIVRGSRAIRSLMARVRSARVSAGVRATPYACRRA